MGDNKNIVLLGGPGAGKGTLSKQIKDEFGYHILSPGVLYRKEAELQTEFGLRAKAYWENGSLCPNEMTNELVRSEVIKLENSNIIFDGYPRTDIQAKYLDSITNIRFVFNLIISDTETVSRLLKRKNTENRIDDTEDVIKKRLIVYHTNNKSIIDYYKLIPKRYFEIDSGKTILETFITVHDIILDEENK